MNRLTGATWDPAPAATAPAAGSLVTFTHSYNKVNQRVGQTVSDNSWISYPATTPVTTLYAANALNQYTTVGAASPTYDANGNLTADGTYALGYDGDNRLTSSSGAGNTAAYAFDAQGRRKSRTVNGATTISVTDADGREVLEYDGATGALLRWYSYALSPNGLLNQMNVAAATRATFLPDQLGSIIAAFDSSSGGLTKTGYQAYGTSASVSTPFGYTGQRFDPENTFYYYRARNYSTAYGRFLQTDPSGAPSDARGGYSSKANLYAYALNDPLNNIDPYGLDTFQIGFSGSLSIPGTSFSLPLGLGIAVDTDFNFGVYAYTGIAAQVGIGAGAGLSVQYSNASTIYDLSGRFANISLNGGAGVGGSVDYFTGPSTTNTTVTGGGATIGVGAGASANVGATTTIVCGSSGCLGNANDLWSGFTMSGISSALANPATPSESESSPSPSLSSYNTSDDATSSSYSLGSSLK